MRHALQGDRHVTNRIRFFIYRHMPNRFQTDTCLAPADIPQTGDDGALGEQPPCLLLSLMQPGDLLSERLERLKTAESSSVLRRTETGCQIGTPNKFRGRITRPLYTLF